MELQGSSGRRENLDLQDNRPLLRQRFGRQEVPIWEKYALTLEEAAMWSGIGVNRLRNLSDNPLCPFVLFVGKKRLIKRKAFENYLEGQIEL